MSPDRNAGYIPRKRAPRGRVLLATMAVALGGEVGCSGGSGSDTPGSTSSTIASPERRTGLPPGPYDKVVDCTQPTEESKIGAKFDIPGPLTVYVKANERVAGMWVTSREKPGAIEVTTVSGNNAKEGNEREGVVIYHQSDAVLTAEDAFTICVPVGRLRAEVESRRQDLSQYMPVTLVAINPQGDMRIGN